MESIMPPAPGICSLTWRARLRFPSTRFGGVGPKTAVAIWDNRSTQHYAVQDYWPAVRKMERAGIIGDAPF